LGADIQTGLQIEARLGMQTLTSGESLDGAQAFVDGVGRGGAFE
jgi:hypothetical protein